MPQPELWARCESAAAQRACDIALFGDSSAAVKGKSVETLFGRSRRLRARRAEDFRERQPINLLGWVSLGLIAALDRFKPQAAQIG
jgi:hypothetical protein